MVNFPSGPLREKIDCLKKYDVVFLNGKDKKIDFNSEDNSQY